MKKHDTVGLDALKLACVMILYCIVTHQEAIDIPKHQEQHGDNQQSGYIKEKRA